jgi:hypothetical protein
LDKRVSDLEEQIKVLGKVLRGLAKGLLADDPEKAFGPQAPGAHLWSHRTPSQPDLARLDMVLFTTGQELQEISEYLAKGQVPPPGKPRCPPFC